MVYKYSIKDKSQLINQMIIKRNQAIEEQRDAIRDLLSIMEMQERRATQEFHLSAEAFMPLWNNAKAFAQKVLDKY